MLDNLLRQLGRELEIQDQIVTQEPGHVIISFDNDMRVEAIQYPQNFILKANIESIPAQDPEDFFVKAMESNLYGRGTRGAAIGLNAAGTTLTLTMDMDNHTNYKVFHDKMEDFISMVSFWRSEVLKVAK